MATETASPYEVVCTQDDTNRWHAERRKGLGASDTPEVLRLSSYRGVIRLWGEKTGELEPEESEATDQSRWGVILEPHVAEEYERQTERELGRWQELVRSTQNPVMQATPDYRIAGTDVPVEIKTTGFFRADEWEDGPPPRVYYQLQHQMYVTGADWGSIGLLIGGSRFHWADIVRDEDAIAYLLDHCMEFWHMVTHRIMPPVDESPEVTEALKALFPHAAETEEIMLPEKATVWDRELTDVRDEIKALTSRRNYLENELRAAIGNAEIGILPDGSGAFTLKNTNRAGYTVPAKSFRTLRRTKAKG